MTNRCVALLMVLAACGAPLPKAECEVAADCAKGQVCTDGVCVTPQPKPDCRDGETRACGPAEVGVCRQGTQTCVSGKWEEKCVGEVVAADETCNSLDDDCDGETDEGAGQPWYPDQDGDGYGASGTTQVACVKPTGFAATSTDCNDAVAAVNPGAAEACGAAMTDENCNGMVNEGCSCTLGMTVACCSGRGVQTCSDVGAGPMLSLCSVSSSTEVCNGIDDDCDGQVDEGACGGTDGGVDAGVPADGGVDAGTGPADAGPTCVPSTEVCDGVDNDCDGMVDEGVMISCNPDDDGDRYFTSGSAVLKCADPSRVAFGQCPVGFVAPSAALGLDCSPADTTKYRVESMRSDADNDEFCVGAASQDCVGASSLPGRRAPATCKPTDDCNDASAAVFRLESTRADADNDTYCVGAASQDCVGASSLPGRRAPATCKPADDCNDASAAVFRLETTRADADNDTFCTGQAASLCTGAATLPGRRLPSACNPSDDCDDANASLFFSSVILPDADGDGRCADQLVSRCTGVLAPAGFKFPAECVTQNDCNDANGSVYRMVNVRLDGDNDGYCIGPQTSQCIGAAAPSGWRLPGNCNATDDCRDTNPLAGPQCVLDVYTTSAATKTCFLVPATESFTVSPTNICPLGFVLGSYRANKLSGNGFCTATSELTLSMTCNGLDGATCNIVGGCVAL